MRLIVSDGIVHFSIESRQPLHKKERDDLIRLFSAVETSNQELLEKKITQLPEADLKIVNLLKEKGILPETIRKEKAVVFLSDNAFAAIHADHLLKGSSFEGGSSYAILDYLSIELKRFGKDKLSDLYENAADWGRRFENAELKDLPVLSTELSKKIRSMKVEEEFLIPSGWANNRVRDAHAMSLLVTKKGDGTYTLVIFNSGAGVEWHPLVEEEQGYFRKEKRQLAVGIQKIPENVMADETVLKAFLEMKVRNIQEPGKPFDSTYVYECLLPTFLIEGRGEIMELDISPSTPQRSGTCFYSSPMAHLEVALGADYQLFKAEVRERSLLEFLGKGEGYFLEKPDRITLLEEAAKKFASSLIDNKEVLGFDRVKRFEEVIVQSLKFAKELKDRVEPSYKLKEQEPMELSSVVLQLNEGNSKKIEPSAVFLIDKVEKDTIIFLEKEFTKRQQALLKEPSKDPKAFLRLQVEVDRVCEAIAVPKKGDPVNSAQFESILRLLEGIATNVSIIDAFPQRTALTFALLQTVLHHTACGLTKGFFSSSLTLPHLSEYSMASGVLPLMQEEGLFLLKDPELEQKKQEVIAYLSQGIPLFSYYNNYYYKGFIDLTEIYESDRFEKVFLSNPKAFAKAALETKNKRDGMIRGMPSATSLSSQQIEDWMLILGGEDIYPKEFAALKRISLLSFELEKGKLEFRSNLFNGEKKIVFNVNDKSFFQSFTQYPKKLNLSSKSLEANIALCFSKDEKERKIKQLDQLFYCSALSGVRLRFIIDFFSEEMTQLKNLENQKLFEAYAFSVDGAYLNEIKEMKNEIQTFVKEGFRLFSREPISYEGALFFIRLDEIFSRYFKEKVLSTDLFFEQALLSNDPGFKAILYFHKCFGLEHKQVEKEDLVNLFAASILMKTFKVPIFLNSPWEFKDALERILAKTKISSIELLKNQETRDFVLNTLGAFIMGKAFKASQWMGNYPLYTAGTSVFDLEKGFFSSEEGYLASPEQGFLTDSNGKIVGKCFNYVPSQGLLKGRDFTFEHPSLGTIATHMTQPTVKKKFDDGLWGTLLFDITPERAKVYATLYNLLVFNMKDGSNRFVDQTSGKTVVILDKTGFYLQDPQRKEQGFSSFLPLLESIDDTDFIYSFGNDSLEGRSFVFPRILTEEGTPLSLVVKDGFYTAKGEEVLLTESHELCFRDPEGVYRYFFRNTPIQTLFPLLKTFSKPGLPDKESQVSFFLIEKGPLGELLPKTDRERVFAIMLMLGQNRFEEAIDLIDQWTFLKKRGVSEVFERILDVKSWQGQNPNQVALLLRLYSKIPFQKMSEEIAQGVTTSCVFLDRIPKEKKISAIKHEIIEKVQEDVNKLLYDYSQTKNNVLDGAHPTRFELITLLELIDYEGFLNGVSKNILLKLKQQEPLVRIKAIRESYLDLDKVDSLSWVIKRRLVEKKTSVEAQDPIVNEIITDYIPLLINKTLTPAEKEKIRIKLCLIQRYCGKGQPEERDGLIMMAAYLYYKEEKSKGFEKLFLEDIYQLAKDYFLANRDKYDRFFGPLINEKDKPKVISPKKKGEVPIDVILWRRDLRTEFNTKVIDYQGSVKLICDIIELKRTQELKRQSLIEKMERLPENENERALALLKRETSLYRPLTLPDLKRALLQGDATFLKSRTYLNDDDFLKFQEEIVNYFVEESNLQQKIALKELIDSQASQEEVQSFSLRERHYNPYDFNNRALLIFEVSTGFLLRKKQVDILSAMGNKENQICQQLAMGQGKTKVLLPLLALGRADGKTIAVIMLPKSLIQTQLEDLGDTSLKQFGRRGHHFSFSRDSSIQPNDLKAHLFLIDQVKQEKGYIVMSSDAIHALFLKYVELLDRGASDSLQLVEQILIEFSQNGEVIIDEMDSVMNARDETLFSTGQKKGLSQEEISFGAVLYEKMVQDKEFLIEENKQYLITDLDKKLEALAKFGLKQLLLDEATYLPFILGKAPLPEGTLTNRLELLLLKGEITTLLPQTLARKGGERYGPSDEKLFENPCIPYIAQVPKEGNQFGLPVETLNYSFQYYIANGATARQAEEWLKKLKAKVIEEAAGSDIPYRYTATGERFFEIFGVHIDEIKKSFQKMVNASFKTKIAFIQDEIAPYISFFPKSYVSDAQNMSLFFNRMLGMTGTPWNHLTYPDQIKMKKDVEELDEIQNKVRKESQKVYLIEGKQFEELEVFKNEHVRALIDVGAFFEGVSNRDVAERLLHCIKQPKGVLYYEEDQLMLLTKKGAIPLNGSDPKTILGQGIPLNDLMTYYDQSHTKGIDILQEDAAKALLFIGKNTFESDLWQGIVRMRKIVKGQGIVPVMDKKEAAFIGKICTFEAVEAHAKKVQEIQVEEDIAKTILRKTKVILAKDLWSRLRELESSQKCALYAKVSHLPLFVQNMDNYLEQYLTVDELKEAKGFLKMQADRFLEDYSTALNLTLAQKEVLQKEIDGIRTEGLPQMIKTGLSNNQDLSTVTEVELELTKQNLVEMDVANTRFVTLEAVPSPSYYTIAWSEINFNQEEVELQKEIIENSESLHLNDVIAPCFSETLYMTKSFAEPFDTNHFPNTSWDLIPYHVLVVGKDTPHYFMVSLEDSRALRDIFDKRSGIWNSTPCALFQRISGRQLTCIGSQFEDIKEHKSFDRVLTEVRFLAGDMHFLRNKKNRAPFEEWWKSEGQGARKKVFDVVATPHEGKEFLKQSKWLQNLYNSIVE